MISCPFVDSRSPPDVSSLLTNPALRCSGGQLQPPAIPGPTPLMSRNLHFPQLIFKRNHLHAHPCFYFSLRKKIKRRGFCMAFLSIYSHWAASFILQDLKTWSEQLFMLEIWAIIPLSTHFKPLATYFQAWSQIYIHLVFKDLRSRGVG